MKLFDTHCHIHEMLAANDANNPTHVLWQKAQISGPEDVVRQAANAGLAGMVCVGTTAKDSVLAVEFAQDRPNCWASIGVHPHEAKGGPAQLKRLAALADKPRVVAVGECGLDYFYSHSSKKDQVKALRFQIELALKHDLPMIFHVRDAFDDFWPIFDEYQNIRGVLHSFTDSAENLQKALKRGLYIGVNGIATFTKNDWQLKVYKSIPLQNLLFETDAPFLTPTPLRGRVNVPANVRLVAEFLAALRDEPYRVIAEATTRNALTLFSIK